jgi:hypothetical protein
MSKDLKEVKILMLGERKSLEFFYFSCVLQVKQTYFRYAKQNSSKRWKNQSHFVIGQRAIYR